jgi:hypothetical protein
MEKVKADALASFRVTDLQLMRTVIRHVAKLVCDHYIALWESKGAVRFVVLRGLG